MNVNDSLDRIAFSPLFIFQIPCTLSVPFDFSPVSCQSNVVLTFSFYFNTQISCSHRRYHRYHYFHHHHYNPLQYHHLHQEQKHQRQQNRNQHQQNYQHLYHHQQQHRRLRHRRLGHLCWTHLKIWYVS